MEPQATGNNCDQKKKVILAAGIDSVSASTIFMHRDLKSAKEFGMAQWHRVQGF